MAQIYFYYVHENLNPKSKIIFKGKKGAVTRHFGLKDYVVTKIFDTDYHVIDGAYYIERKLLSEVSEEDRRPVSTAKKRKTKLDETVDMVERMLDIYGNTIIYKDFEKVEARLNRDGYFIRAKHEPERRIKVTTMSKGDGLYEVYDECWIVELVRKEKIENDIY